MKAKRFISLILSVISILSIAVTGTINTQALDDSSTTDVLLGRHGLGDLSFDDIMASRSDSDTLTVLPQRIRNCRNTLPQSLDLSMDSAFPCIGDQGSIGSCCSWATTYYQFGYQVAKMNNWNAKYDTSLQFSPKYTYNYANGGKDEGSCSRVNYSILKYKGAVRYNEFTPLSQAGYYEYRSWDTNIEHNTNALKYTLTSNDKYNFDNSDLIVTSPESPCILGLKELLCSGHILLFSTDYGVGVYDTTGVYYDEVNERYYNNSDWIYKTLNNGEWACIMGENNNTSHTGHAMTIVGYDDTIWYDYNHNNIQESSELGAFKVANSHGTEYANEGFIWVMYDALNKSSSNVEYNTSHRKSIIESYCVEYIEVGENKNDLIAEINLSQTKRRQHGVYLGVDELDNMELMQLFSGGGFRYDGSYSPFTTQTASFPLSFDKIVSGNRPWYNYKINIRDLTEQDPTYINSIVIKDRTGKIIVNDTIGIDIDYDQILYNYYIGMMGDVNNDGLINESDVTVLQYYFAHMGSLSSEQEIVSDVDGDNDITVVDVTWIQRKIIGMIDEFSNGAFALLE